jgi:glycosyltransferase involved in cell wall biosynthesis
MRCPDNFMTSQSISLIVPAYKEESTIVEQVKELSRVLSKKTTNFEIIVVVDGFNDKTFERAKKIETPNLKIFGYEKNMGKGYAVKYGVNKATKDIIGFIDSGMDIDPESIGKLITTMDEKEADIVIGSKIHPGSTISYPFFRKILSSGYRFINKLLFGFAIADTQVGLKMFKREVAKNIFSKVKINGFAFDIEVLVLAQILRYEKIYEAPIKVNLKDSLINYVNLLGVAFLMLVDTIKIFFKFRVLNSYKIKE